MEYFFLPFVMMGIIMVYLHIITVNVVILFFHIYINESVENKHYFLPLISLCEDINLAHDCRRLLCL